MTSPTDFISSGLSTTLRGFAGIVSRPAARQPAQLLVLYDMEGCPYCRLVREALTELDLDAAIQPCPRGGRRFRPEVSRLGGKQQFPFLVDPNTGVSLYESLDIVAYLFATYGQRELPARWRRGGLQQLGAMVAGLPRLQRGLSRARRRSTRQRPDDLAPLELFSFEGSPFARRVRETLCELELAYTLRSCGRNRPSEWLPPLVRDHLRLPPDSVLHNRVDLLQREGRMSIPYLHDPNTGQSLFDSDRIIRYLRTHYA